MKRRFSFEKILTYFKTGEGYGQEGLLAVENLSQQIPYKHGKDDDDDFSKMF